MRFTHHYGDLTQCHNFLVIEVVDSVNINSCWHRFQLPLFILFTPPFYFLFHLCPLPPLLPSVLQAAMSSPAEEPSAAVSAVLSSALSAAVSAAMAVAMSVDAKADLSALLDEWEEAQRGPTEQLVSVLTKWAAVIRSWCHTVSVSADQWADGVSSVFPAEYLSWLNERQENITKQILTHLMTVIQVITLLSLFCLFFSIQTNIQQQFHKHRKLK